MRNWSCFPGGRPELRCPAWLPVMMDTVPVCLRCLSPVDRGVGCMWLPGLGTWVGDQGSSRYGI